LFVISNRVFLAQFAATRCVKGIFCFSQVRHSGKLLAGIQAKHRLDPRLKHSGVTILRFRYGKPKFFCQAQSVFATDL
jgi:hypothetical protein